MTPVTGPAERLGGPRVGVDDRLLARLQAVCAVSTDAGDRTDHGRDWWPITLHWARDGGVAARPAVVARPADAAQVAAVLAACDEARVPVTPAAGRSGVCGASVPVFGGVALDLRGLAGIVGVDDRSLLVEVGAGTFGDAFEDRLQADHGLTVGHWPQSMAISTVGGWLACRSAGQYSTRYGTVADLAAGLEVALADGRIVRTGGRAPRSAAGPDLTQLFVGSEGTLGVITSAMLRARPRPPAHGRAAYRFASFADGLDACRRVLRRGARPAVLRLYDEVESRRDHGVDDGCLLLVLDEAEAWDVDAAMGVVASECAGADALDAHLVGRWLERRNDVSVLPALVAAGIVVDTCEVAGRWSALSALHRACADALASRPGMLVASVHMSHAYADGGCLYVTFAGRPPDDGPADAWYVGAWDAVMAATLAAGGAISHHHGIGLNRARFLPAALGAGFDTLVALKAALDPHGVLNPGKLGLPSPWGSPPWPR